MKRHPEAIAWGKWLASEEGQNCSDPTTIGAEMRQYEFLKNRLSRAFRAGADYAEKQRKIEAAATRISDSLADDAGCATPGDSADAPTGNHPRQP